MEQAGLKPGGPGGSWVQPVPLVRIDRMPGATMTLNLAGKPVPLVLGKDATLGLRNPGQTELADMPLVFGGFGVVGQGYDAYKGVDMAGKIAVVLANDPDFEAGTDLGFEGRRLVMAGRIGSKFEAAAKAGALGVLVIHEDAAASYPWLQVGSGDALPTMAPAPLKPSPLAFSRLAGRAGGGGAAEGGEHRSRNAEGPRPRAGVHRIRPAGDARPVGQHQVDDLHQPQCHRPAARRQIARPVRALWRALGRQWHQRPRCDRRRHPQRRRRQCHRHRRASGSGAGVCGRAEAGAQRGVRRLDGGGKGPARQRLLRRQPGVAARRAPSRVINLDPHVVLPAARNIELVGVGRTPLEKDLEAAAASLGLRVDAEPNPEAGWYFRSDHYPFARRGVPSLSFRAGRDLVEGGTAKGDALVGAYNATRYHQPSDQFMPDWTFAGTAQEASVAYLLGRKLADGTDWPMWNAGNEYAPLRASGPK